MAGPLSLSFALPFSEAIAWAKDRVAVLPEVYYETLPAQARSRAFTVSGLAALDQIQGVLDSLHKATAEGLTFAEWRKAQTPEALALGPARLDNIFRTAIQTHYNIGRYQQQERNKAHRPFLMYDAINDGRTRPHHRALDNLIAAVDDPIWRKIYPPNGFFCRCSTRTLTEAQAVARGWKGVPNIPHDGGADEGWAYHPGLEQDDALERYKAQRLAKAAPELRAAAERAMVQPVAPLRVFEPQPTARAAAEWAVRNNLADYADYNGVKPEVANEWNRSLFDHLSEFPELRAQQKFVGTGQAQIARWREIEIQRYFERLKAANPGVDETLLQDHAERRVKQIKMSGTTWAHSWGQEEVSGIAVNKKWGADVEAFKKSIEVSVNSGFHPPGCDTIRSVVDHELGHQLDDLLGLHIDAAATAIYNEAKAKGIGKEVSRYAEKNIKEFISECWSESINNPEPREYARRIAELVRARYAAKYPRA